MFTYDTPGQAKFRNLWEPYLKNRDGLVFVLDIADKKQIDAAKSPSSFLTVQIALELNRPFIINPTPQELNRFLFKHKPGVVNIAGSRADKWTKGLTDFKAKNKIYSQLQSTISEGISTTSQSAKAAKPRSPGRRIS